MITFHIREIRSKIRTYTIMSPIRHGKEITNIPYLLTFPIWKAISGASSSLVLPPKYCLAMS